MAQNQATNERGMQAPSRLKRMYWSTYLHIPSGKTYRQVDLGNANNWKEIVDKKDEDIEYLNDLLDVKTDHNQDGDLLSWDDALQMWVNIPSPVVELGKALIVSTKGTPVSTGAVRESWSHHFSDINEAIAASLDGDTIYVYGGNHTLTTSMVPVGKNIKWRLEGEPEIRGFVTLIADNGVASTVDIKGDGVFVALSSQAIYITANDTLAHIECKSITGPGFAVVRLAGGKEGCYLDVKNTIICTGTSYTVRLELNANWTINARRIENAATSATFRNAVIIRPGYIGTSTINAETIINTSNYVGRGVIAHQGNSGSKMTINVSKIIKSNPTPGANNIAISHNSYNLTINGDIDGNAGKAIYTTTNSAGAGATLVHNGDAWNDGTDVLVYLAAASTLVKLNGTYTSSNAIVVNHIAADLTIDGKIVNTKPDGGSTGVFVTGGNPTVFNTAKIIMTVFDATEVAVNASAAKNIKIIHSLVGNVDLDIVNITNLIPYSSYNFDAAVE